MMVWQEKQISQLGKVVTGKTPPTSMPEYFGGNELFVSPKDLGKNTYFVYETETKITDKALEKFRNQVLPKNAVMFTSLSFSFGKMGITSKPCLTNQQINSVVVDNYHDFRFVYYLLRAYEAIIFSYNSGIDTPIVPKSIFESIKVLVPTLLVQKKIAAILSAYDDLIENNQRRIALLEKMAEELYREWFVRFRFPGHEHVKFGKGFPGDWGICDLGGIVEEIIDYRGVTPAKLGADWQDFGVKALSALNVKNGKLIKLGEAKCVSDILYERWMRKELRKFDILLTSEAPLGQVCMLLGDEKYVLSQRVFGIRADLASVQPSYLYQYLLFDIGQHELLSKATGSTVGGIRQQLLRKVSVVLPPADIQEKYAEIIVPMLEEIEILEKKKCNLSESRDSLLPRLISGKLSVADLDIAFPPSMQDAAP